MAKKNIILLRSKIVVLFFSSILFFRAGLCALAPDIAVTQYVMDTWTVDDGLPQNTVTCITQTHDGYIWVGTGNGLTRFDGSTFTVFNTANTDEMIGHDVGVLYEDRNRNLWVGTMRGLSRFRHGKFEDFPGHEEFDNKPVNAILEDNRNNLWLWADRRLFRWTNGRFEYYRKQDELAGKRIRFQRHGKENTIWIGTGAGLYRCRNNRIENISEQAGSKKEFIMYLFEDKQGCLWAGTGNGLWRYRDSIYEQVKGTEGLFVYRIGVDEKGDLWFSTDIALMRLRNGRPEIFSRDESLIGEGIRREMKDRDGNLWLGSKQGLYRCRRGQFARLTTGNGLTDDDIYSLFEDRQGNLWVGTKRGLVRLKNPGILTYSTEEGLHCDSFRSIFQDSRGRLWLAGDCLGLTRFEDGKFKIIMRRVVSSDLRIGGAFCEDSRGCLWSGITLNRFRNGRFERFRTADDRTTTAVLVMLEDQPGRFWVGTKYGLLRFEPSEPEEQRFTTFTTKDGLANNYITELIKARDGTMWIGTLKGVSLYKGGTFFPVREGKGLQQVQVNDIVQDEEGTVWLGTYSGLFRYRDRRFVRYAGRDGLPDDAVLGILEDSKGNLWMSSNLGIFYIKKTELHDFAAGRIAALHPLTFDRNDGMKSEECNCGSQPTCWKARDGKLWFPTMKGAAVIDPENLKSDTTLPPVYIEKVVCDGKSIDINDMVVVPPGTKRIEFYFTAVNFTNPGKVRFRCRLAGHDKHYVEQGPERERIAHYMNVPGGSYRFNVTASSSAGSWDMSSGAGIDVKIIPAYYETWWFKAVMLLGFASLSYLVFSFIKKYFYLFAFWKRTNYIGQYVIIEPIGCGGMATVFKARHMLKKKKIVAIKVLKREFISRPLTKKRFKQEGVSVDKLEHPHIIKILERGEQEDSFYLVMEFLRGRTLAEKIKQEQQLNIAAFLDIMEQIMGVLAVLHGQQIIHRDLKPSNIMLIKNDGRDNFVKLLDFGLARSNYDTRITESGSLLGTLPYISPEQITRSVFSPAGDIYASGVIAYEMVTGRLPFADCSELEIMQVKLDKDPVRPIELRPGLPSFINRLIMEMLARDPEARPTAEQIMKRLRDAAP